MAFVYEKLTEQDKELITSFKLPNPLSHSRLANTPRAWVADRERNLYLICLGGQGHMSSEEYPPSFFYLIWNGQLIRMQTYYSTIGNMKEKRQYYYKVYRILAPSNLSGQSEMIIETIKEAITEYEKGSSQFFGSMEFVEVGKPFFTEGDIRYY